MSTPLALIAQGSFVSTGAATTIELPRQPHYFVIENRTQWGAAASVVIRSWWYDGYAAGQASGMTDAADDISASAIAAGGAGFTFVDMSSQAPGALIASGTAATAATPIVVTDGVPPAVGDIVRMFNTTAMLQIAGLDFSVTAVTPATNYTLGYAVGAGYAAAATNADYRIIPAKYYSPYRRWIANITAAAAAVISVTVGHNYLVGDEIVVHNPDANFGMTQINGLQGTITAVTANTITTDINSAAFGAFAYPTSAIAAAGVSFPHVTHVGEVATKLTSSVDNVAYYGMYLDTGVVGANTNVMDWMAFARDYTV